MPTVNPKFQDKNGLVLPYEALTAVKGGQLVIPQTGATTSGNQGVQPAGAGALNCLGIAQSDAVPTSGQAAFVTGTSAYDSGYPQIDTTVPDPTLSVYSAGVFPILYVAGAVAYGQRLKCGAAGTVAAWVDGTDTDAALMIGWCAQPGGAAGGTIALVRLKV